MQIEFLTEILENSIGRKHVATTKGVAFEGLNIFRGVSPFGEYATTVDRKGNVSTSVSVGAGLTTSRFPSLDLGYTYWFDAPELLYNLPELGIGRDET